MLALASSQRPAGSISPIVDIDGALVRSDLVIESSCAMIARDPTGPARAAQGGEAAAEACPGLFDGRVSLLRRPLRRCRDGGASAPTLRSSVLALRYVGFAALATAANLLAQEAAVRLAPGAPLALSVVAGTGTGFVLKYLLDKHLIFHDATAGRAAEAAKVVLYSLFSVFTTLLFWAFEFGFDALWGGDRAKYAGAVVGLAIGYVLKYRLDRRFVFRTVRT